MIFENSQEETFKLIGNIADLETRGHFEEFAVNVQTKPMVVDQAVELTLERARLIREEKHITSIRVMGRCFFEMHQCWCP